ncbi:MAG: EAL domain-containing response regulator [Pseudomonadota bacterium]
MANPCAGTLLIVDDERSVRRSLQRLLRSEGYSILAAADTQGARQILETDDVDVIICDQDMPGESGTTFLLDVASRFPQQRRIMLSGRFQSDDVAVAIDAGAVHRFMMKPWDDAILKADVRASFRQLMAGWEDAQPAHVPAGAAPEVTPSQDTWQRFNEQRRLSRELHEAASDGSLSLQYQPQIALRTGNVCGVEALLRWNSSTGPVSPGRFIDLAERCGAMTKLSHWVVCETSFRLAEWLALWPGARVAFNMSPSDLKDCSLIDYLARMLDEHSLPPQSIEVEITESQVIDRNADSVAQLQRIAELGVELAIDDFGAGATSIAYLADLPFTTVKLDRSLIEQCATDEGIAVVQKVIEMAHCVDMQTVVEGIETEEQHAIAKSIGADIAQGYFYGRPQSLAPMERWLAGGCVGVPS